MKEILTKKILIGKTLTKKILVGKILYGKIFGWSLLVILLDQLSKWYIVANVPLNDFHEPFFSLWGGYLNIIHVRNPAIAFSIGLGLPAAWKTVLFKILPLLVLGYISYIVACDRHLHKMQRSCLAVIVGGGIGNMIDRIFRPLGVVDFVDTDFWNINIDWGILQYTMYRWPTYNLADASVLIGLSLFAIYSLFFITREQRHYQLQHVGTRSPQGTGAKQNQDKHTGQ